MEFVVPSDKVVKMFDSISQAIFDRILSNENQTYTLTRLRDTLLPKLMSGQLRVQA